MPKGIDGEEEVHKIKTLWAMMTKHPSFRPRMIHRNVNRDTLVMLYSALEGIETTGISIFLYAWFVEIIIW